MNTCLEYMQVLKTDFKTSTKDREIGFYEFECSSFGCMVVRQTLLIISTAAVKWTTGPFQVPIMTADGQQRVMK